MLRVVWNEAVARGQERLAPPATIIINNAMLTMSSPSGIQSAQTYVLKPRDAVYRSVKRGIVMNEIRPGEALTELGLARRLNCSQGPVREALLRLEQDGLVLRKPNRATTVTPLPADEAREILALRRRIEMIGAHRAAPAATDADIESLEALVLTMKEAAQEGDEFGLIEIDTELHLALFRLSGLQALEPILSRCILHSHRSKLWEPRHRRPLVQTAMRHGPILAALASRDGDRLAEALSHHIETIVDTEASD
jgi:GntR family transcriptional regulator, rspAB operon transcriptional repressor